MNAIVVAALAVLAVFGASILVERLLGRSRKEFHKPAWFIVFFSLFLPGVAIVYSYVSVDSPFIYAAYALSAGVAALVAQGLFGVRLPASREGKGDA